jgi:hypothetical protein
MLKWLAAAVVVIFVVAVIIPSISDLIRYLRIRAM